MVYKLKNVFFKDRRAGEPAVRSLLSGAVVLCAFKKGYSFEHL